MLTDASPAAQGRQIADGLPSLAAVQMFHEVGKDPSRFQEERTGMPMSMASMSGGMAADSASTLGAKRGVVLRGFARLIAWPGDITVRYLSRISPFFIGGIQEYLPCSFSSPECRPPTT